MLTEKQIAIYRGLVGLQVKYAEDGDQSKTTEMQLIMEGQINIFIREAVMQALAPFVDAYMSPKMALTKEQLIKYRKLVVQSYEVAEKRNFEDWAKFQHHIEQWIGEVVDNHMLTAVQPYITKIK